MSDKFNNKCIMFLRLEGATNLETSLSSKLYMVIRFKHAFDFFIIYILTLKVSKKKIALGLVMVSKDMIEIHNWIVYHHICT